MAPALELTSIPPWATAPARPVADVSGRSWTVLSLDPAAGEIVAGWIAELNKKRSDPDVALHHASDDAAAREALEHDLAHALVGWRLMIAGPAAACLRLRAHAVRAGVADDEITVATTEVADRDVICVHCWTVTGTTVALEEVTPCAGCGRNLLVYYHVSRRLGAHLGFMADAERPS
ncbi:MAG: dimethylamine monooxygenase subunit DmmA family protein [Mycobacterium sp.]